MDNELIKLFLTELNMVSYKPGEISELTDDKMAKALTLNENLLSLGYTLKPSDIMLLAVSDSCGSLYEDILNALPDVKADPMYPDFPKQVMNMDEAVFRFHQALHYLSTYGIEMITGTKVKRGWLPEVERTEKTKSDTRLFDSRVLEMVAEDEIYAKALKRILGKREQITIPETILVKNCFAHVDKNIICDIKITYKKNIETVFDMAIDMSREDGVLIASSICQHTGDVLKNIFRFLKDRNFHLRTSQKRTFVRILESFSADDFRANLMLSKQLRERNLLILQRLDYNAYSKSEKHKKAVDELRNDKLRSWEAVAKYKLINHEEDALDYLAKRPGSMIRMINWLLKLGYSEEDITDKLCQNARVLNTQTLVTLINKFSKMSEVSIRANTDKLRCDIERKYAPLSYQFFRFKRVIRMKKAEAMNLANWKYRHAKNDDDRAMYRAELERLRAEYDRKIAHVKEFGKLQEKKNSEINMVKMREESSLNQLATLPVKMRILLKVLEEHFAQIDTSIRDKKVYLDMDEFDLENSELLCSDKSQEGGYIPSGIAYRIPEDSKVVRFFVYWNDEVRVDVDLHANGVMTDGSLLHIGWNGDYSSCGVTHSGDITHSNAAEYIDIDVSKPVKRINTNVYLFSGKKALSEIDECYVGMMAVDNVNEDVYLYDRANCYFSHDVRMDCRALFYGYIDVDRHYVKFIGKSGKSESVYPDMDERENVLSLNKYLEILFRSQNSTVVDSKEEADIILSMGKSILENGLSLVDENFFLDAV